MIKNKRGISGIVESILLVALTVAAAAILFVFVLGFVNDKLDNTKICSELQGQISVAQGQYTCFNSSGTRIMIERGQKAEEIIGFRVSLKYSGTSKVFDIKQGIVSGVKMYNGNSNLTIPAAGGSETYVFDNIPNTESVSVAPITINDKTCDAISEIVNDCNAV